MNTKEWLSASRPRTLPLAVSCVLLGAAVAKAEILGARATPFFGVVVGGALLTVVLLQILANFANDYGDFVKGTDVAADRQDRALASGAIQPLAMKRALMITSALAFVAGVATIWASLGPGASEVALEWKAEATSALVVLGVLAILAAIKYTIGSKSYGYSGLGDLFVFLFFGWIGVMGVGFLVAHDLSWTWLLPATFSGCMSVAVLNLNNLRDHENDRSSGKNTLVVRMGFGRAKTYHLLILGLGWCCLALYFWGPWMTGQWRGTMWYALIALVHAKHGWMVHQNQNPKKLDPELRRVALSTFVIGLFMFLDQTLSA